MILNLITTNILASIGTANRRVIVLDVAGILTKVDNVMEAQNERMRSMGDEVSVKR